MLNDLRLITVVFVQSIQHRSRAGISTITIHISYKFAVDIHWFCSDPDFLTLDQYQDKMSTCTKGLKIMSSLFWTLHMGSNTRSLSSSSSGVLCNKLYKHE